MDWVWIAAAVVSVWALLRVIGAERQRRMNELILQIAIQQAEDPRRPTPSASPTAGAAAQAVRSKATR